MRTTSPGTDRDVPVLDLDQARDAGGLACPAPGVPDDDVRGVGAVQAVPRCSFDEDRPELLDHTVEVVDPFQPACIRETLAEATARARARRAADTDVIEEDDNNFARMWNDAVSTAEESLRARARRGG